MSEEYKCKDCKWLTGRKNIRGIECMNPVLQEKWNGAKNLWMGELRKDTARYKQRNAPACKKFEAKESEHMGRYIDADALIAKMPTVMDMQDAYLPIHFKEWLIDEAPTIEPKRGEWKPFDLTWGRSIWYCTACEESTEVPCDIWKHKPIYKYCPNCGARMKGADDEQ